MEIKDVQCMYCGSEATRFSEDLSESVCECCHMTMMREHELLGLSFLFHDEYVGDAEEF